MYYEGDRDYMYSKALESASRCLYSWGVYIMIDIILIPIKSYLASVCPGQMVPPEQTHIQTYGIISVFTNGLSVKKKNPR